MKILPDGDETKVQYEKVYYSQTILAEDNDTIDIRFNVGEWPIHFRINFEEHRDCRVKSNACEDRLDLRYCYRSDVSQPMALNKLQIGTTDDGRRVYIRSVFQHTVINILHLQVTLEPQ